MNLPPIEIDPQIMRTGVKRAWTRNSDALLCVLGLASVRFISLSGPRMMVSLEHPLAGPKQARYYVLPLLVARLIASPLGQMLSRLTLSTVGKDVVMGMTDERGEYRMHWPADLRQFLAPPEFTQMVAVPKDTLGLKYLSLSDAAHQAVAHLVNLQSAQNIPSEKLAILVDFGASYLVLDGRTIVHGPSGAYYFDPRLIIRALELVKSNEVQVGMTPLSIGHRAVLTILADEDGWRVQCAMLSVGLDTQRLYPLPAERLPRAQQPTPVAQPG